VEYWDLDGNFVKIIQKDLRMPAAVHIRGNYAVVPELQAGSPFWTRTATLRSARR